MKEIVEYSYINSKFYGKKLSPYIDNFRKNSNHEILPFTTKDELRSCKLDDLISTSYKEIVRVHSSSGTTGNPVIAAYTQNDIDDWLIMLKRMYDLIGISSDDIVHITPSYGMWTAGIGFQMGAESVGALVVPVGSGNTQNHIEYMDKFKPTTIVATSSYGLTLARIIDTECIAIKDSLKYGIFGSEIWNKNIKKSIEKKLGIKAFETYGLTEIYGPGIAISCSEGEGMHYWNDFIFCEIIDPITTKVLNEGEIGELVITTLKKEGMPLLRYRTGDLTYITYEACKCGCKYPKIGTILGRVDDTVKFRGVQISPAIIEQALKKINILYKKFQLHIYEENFKEMANLYVESTNRYGIKSIEIDIKKMMNVNINVKFVDEKFFNKNLRKHKYILDERAKNSEL